jgi:glycosyltransferase involved in cell wall biosynthesis
MAADFAAGHDTFTGGRRMAQALVFLAEAFGARGGIAQFNRDLLASLSSDPAYTKVVALPRIPFAKSPKTPTNVEYRGGSAGGNLRYLIESLRAVVSERFDVVICSHVSLITIASAAAAAQRVPLLLVVYGSEAWTALRNGLAARLAKRADAVVATSEHTKRRFLEWSKMGASQVHVIPSCVDAKRFGVGHKRDDLLRRYRLRGRTVLLTVARLAGNARARGIEEVMESLTDIAREIPNISYLIVGDGHDRGRLEEKALALGVDKRVVFAGYVSEAEKADHFRLGDAYVMPGRGESGGIAFLEALACGLPIVASSLDASGEIVRNRNFGRVVNPDHPAELQAAVVDVLSESDHKVPRELCAFSRERYRARWNWLLAELRVGELDSRPALSREPESAGGWVPSQALVVQAPAAPMVEIER